VVNFNVLQWFRVDIPQIAAGFSLILLPFRSLDKAKPARWGADQSNFEPPRRLA
jgi:hypothetical protein